MDKHTPALQHVAVSENGELRWMTGRKPRDCELYAMPDGGRLSQLYATAPELLEALNHIERKLDFYLKHQTEIPVKEVLGMWDVAYIALKKSRGGA